MDDEHALLDGPEPEPPTNAAAEAFTRLAARVEGLEERLDGRMAMMTRALEHIAVEKQGIEIPDYNPTLTRMSGHLADMGKRMKAVENAPALQMTPETMAERIGKAAETAREADRAAIKDTQELHRQTIATMSKATGNIRAKDEQRRHMLYAIGGAILAISLLWLIYPGWAANIGPQGWLWPERAARRTMGEPTLWDAGIRLMRAGNPEGWQAIVDAADMTRENRDAIAACQRTAAKDKNSVRCVVRISESRP